MQGTKLKKEIRLKVKELEDIGTRQELQERRMFLSGGSPFSYFYYTNKLQDKLTNEYADPEFEEYVIDDIFTKLALSIIQDRIDSASEESTHKNIE